MPEHLFETEPKIIAFVDVIGTSKILKSEDKDKTRDFMLGLNGFYDALEETIPGSRYKTFSDNVAIYSDECTAEAAEAMVQTVARLQFNMAADMGLLLRGGVNMGQLEHSGAEDSNDYIIGEALVDAYELESKHAVYPRVLLDDKVLRLIGDSPVRRGFVVSDDTDHPYINYLQVTEVDGFYSNEALDAHGKALRAHAERNNAWYERGTPIRGRDRDAIRSKDLWAISYHNMFCDVNDMEECRLDFTVEHSSGRAIIRFRDGAGVERWRTKRC